MTRKTRIDFNALIQRFQIRKPWDSIIIFILNILIAIPVFIIVHENIVDANLYFKLDRVFLFISILVIIQLVLRALRRITLVSIFLYLVALFYGTLFGGYGFASVYDDYDAMMYSMTHSPYPEDIIIDKLLPFPNKAKIISAIEYDNPKVRDFAIAATLKDFRDVRGYSKYRTIIQCFAVAKEINSEWNYVSDPHNEDYIAPASESVRYLSGDCDDHSVLMAACVRAIGGTPRIIFTNGHMYPEMLIGNLNDMETINFLIRNKLFARETQNKPLHYHLDEHAQVWLNLDYTAIYPGGPFLHKEILSALTLD